MRRRVGPGGRRPDGDRNLWLDPQVVRARRSGEAPPEAARARRRLTMRAKLLLAALVVAGTGAVAAWSVWSGLLPRAGERLDLALALETISVEGNGRADAAELVAASGLEAGTPLFAIDVEGVKAALETHPWVQRASVVRVPPSLVLLSIVERDPLAIAPAADASPLLVDSSGLAVAPAAPEDLSTLPWITAPEPAQPGAATPELGRAAVLALALRGRPFADGAEIRVAAAADPEGLSLVVPGLRARVLLGHGALADKLDRLVRLREAELSETEGADVIDLRFEERAVLRPAAVPEALAATTAAPGPAPPPPGRRL